LTEKRKLRIAKVCESIVAGNTVTQAAKDAGYNTPSGIVTASRIINSPEGQECLAAILAKNGLTDSRMAKEIDRGLKQSRPEGKHGDYVDRLIDLLGHRKSNNDHPTVNILNILSEQIERDGILMSDGSVKRINMEEGK
jgi:phage terminase small subunit